MKEKKKIAAVVGATASGKSALALALAKDFSGEIISCDSMQIYRGMDIGTAKPTKEELLSVSHKMIDIADPDENFSCADYVKMARTEVDETLERGALPIFCGGTGLYLDSFLRGSDFAQTQIDTELRRSLEEFAEVNGNDALHDMLRTIDPESADAIHKNNVKRVIRAIEIYKTSGRTKSELDRLSLEEESEYDALVIGLRYKNRDVLYDRIEKRVDIMLRDGLLSETRALYESGVFEKNTTATQAIGYKEMLAYIRGEMSLEEATETLKMATRRYAKRQMTWFESKKYVKWIEVCDDDGVKTFEEIVNCAKGIFYDFGFCDKIK